MRNQQESPILSKTGDQLETAELYELLRLRTIIFVIEQDCVYNDLDGRDLLASTTHYWSGDITHPDASIRVLGEQGSAGEPRWIIGRVVTREQARGKGLAAHLITAALADFGHHETALEAQSHLRDYYARFGYHQAGPEYLEDGIAHTPMIRPATPANKATSKS